MSFETDFDSAFTILLGKAVGVITPTGVQPSTGSGSTTTTGVAAVSAGLEFVIDGGGAAIPTGNSGGLIVPFNCQINKVQLQEFDGITGSIAVTIQKGTPGPNPTFTSIIGSAIPAIVSGRYYLDDVLSGWTTALVIGDALRYVVTSSSTIRRVTVVLSVRRTDVSG